MNRPLNGASAEQQVQVNPIALARFIRETLRRDARPPEHEHELYSLACAMLDAIANGGVRLVGTHEVQQSLPLDVPPAPPESPPPAH